jgi:hypothetical protein
VYRDRPFFKKRGNVDFNPFDRRDSFCIRNHNGDTGYYDKNPKTVHFIIPGTNEFEEWILNFSFWKKKLSKAKKVRLSHKIDKKVKVHAGFLRSALRLWRYYKQIIKDKDVVILGSHSHGAAVITILALWTRIFFPEKLVVSVPESSPRVGNRAFKKLYESLGVYTYRVFHDGDIVCNVPKIGYHHVARPIRLGKLPWWRFVSKTLGLPWWHYPDLLPPLIKKAGHIIGS